MGICMSAEQKALARDAQRNRELEQQLERDHLAAQRTVKLLLLGAGESGKSTLVKQMRIIHGDGYQHQDLINHKQTIIDNLLVSMRAVIEAMGALRIDLGDQANRVHVKAILTASGQQALSPELSAAIKSLWGDSGVRACFARANEYQLNDSAKYYFNSIDRISSPEYVPTQQDVLRSRVKTTGVIETSFEHRGITYKLFDVGGQRTERRKWISCFDDVTAVIFVTALSGYDLTIFEDQKTNRMTESLKLFSAICNNKFFINTAIILFLNKTDLFAEKIATTPLRNYFPEYEGPEGNAKAAQQFLLSKFKALNQNPNKKIYEHFTCATDTNNIKHVFDAASDVIIEKHLSAAGLDAGAVM
jgi:GTPase SAR1 family protein